MGTTVFFCIFPALIIQCFAEQPSISGRKRTCNPSYFPNTVGLFGKLLIIPRLRALYDARGTDPMQC